MYLKLRCNVLAFFYLYKIMEKIIIAITGASGSVYAKRLIEKLEPHSKLIKNLEVVFSDAGKQVWDFEINEDLESKNIRIFENTNLFSPIASGSAKYNTMVIIPCSMGTVGRIANGISNDLISRAADVIIKERKKLIVVPRETPFSSIHLNNLKIIADAGGIIIPANPSFYHKPQTITELIDTVVDKVIEHIGFNSNAKEWGS